VPAPASISTLAEVGHCQALHCGLACGARYVIWAPAPWLLEGAPQIERTKPLQLHMVQEQSALVELSCASVCAASKGAFNPVTRL
jgi:hypothetical protein